ncbi:MAG TPA: fatty acyl-AMP ligase [Polyangiaceae bacterium]|nr:fatty acyl-AMP ligase [Polyangiaceae bacterium]
MPVPIRHVARQVAPTLVDAVCALEGDAARGFVFVRTDGTEHLWSFQAMAGEARRRAAALADCGLKKGERVALAIPDGEQFVLSLLGTLFAGLVPVPLYPPVLLQSASQSIDAYHATVTHIASAAGASLLLTTATARPYLEAVLGRVEGLRAIVTVEELATSNGAMRADVSADDLALIQFTSGSTSRPKGVVVTHGNLATNSEAFMIHGLRRDPGIDKGVSWLPLFHDMGLIGFVVGPLFTNVPCVLLPTASFARRPRLWLDKIHEHRGTITYAPNFAYALVNKRLREKDVADLDLSCLRISGCGAEPIDARALREFAAVLAPARFDPRALLPSYGMAEATLAITFTPLGEGVHSDAIDPAALAHDRAVAPPAGTAPQDTNEVVDCGRVFPGHELAIIDADGARLADRRVGQIVFRGPSVSDGYFREPELTAQTFRPLAGDGPGEPPWLHTGDLGYTIGERLFVCGRAKDIIIVRGRNYHPSDIEWAVAEGFDLPSGARRGHVVAFGVRVDAQGRASAAGNGEEQLVLCCEGHSSDADAIRDGAIATVASRFGLTVHEVVVARLASLPRTSSGKPRRRETRSSYLDGTLARARSVQSPESQAQPPEKQAPESGREARRPGPA